MTKDITVSKLSKLQKQILGYARKAMLAKGQTIEPPDCVTICYSAPKWLDDALTKALVAIFESRKSYAPLAELDRIHVHPWMWFFEEMRFLRQTIVDAAKEAEIRSEVDVLALFNLAVSPIALMGIKVKLKAPVSYEAWPTFDNGWKFYLYVKGVTVEQVLESIKDMIGEDGMRDIAVSSPKIYPVNCTVPELLRDIFGFPLQEAGHIDALAFCVDEIGKQRYDNAQAVLRRACDRLSTRGLIRLRGGQRTFRDPSFYVRTGIGLTDEGIVVADELLRADNQKASADLGISLEAAALL